MTEIDTVDIENLLIADLATWLAGQGWDVGEGAGQVRVADLLPPGELAKGVGLIRLGGPMLDLVTDNPTISIEVKSDGWSAAWTLIKDCRKWAHQLVGLSLAGDIGVNFVDEFGGPTRNAIDDSPYRYTMTLSMGVQAVVS